MMVKRLQDARSWSTIIPPLVQKKLSDRQDEARFMTVGSSSGTTKKRRLEVQPQVAAVDYSLQNLSQSVSLYSSANNTLSSNVPAAFTWIQSVSQPLSQNVPLHFSSNATQQTGSKADPGTAAGLDINWTGLF
ncbi:hypothetical protein Q3G72_008663 [Acer saccharum]|nr:hypothetical protein Q3G72_008663 [Acer saccharum]